VNTLLDTTVTLVAWTFVVSRLGVFRRRRSTDRRVLHSWLFILFFALGLTFQIDAVYVAFDTLVGVPNLSWLVFAISIAVALYFSAAVGYAILDVPSPRWMILNLAGASTIFLVVFAAGIAASPEWPCTSHVIPRTVFDWLFLGTECVYGAIQGSIAALVFLRLYRVEQHPLGRFRWATWWATALSGTTLYLTKGVLINVGYLWPTSPVTTGLIHLVMIARWATCLMWPWFVLPNRACLALMQPLEWMRKLVTLKHLRRSQAEAHRLLRALWPEAARMEYTPAFRECLSNLDFHTYRLVISILDSARLLALFLERTERGQVEGWMRDAGLNRPEDAMPVRSFLEKASGATEYQDLVVVCAGVWGSLGG